MSQVLRSKPLWDNFSLKRKIWSSRPSMLRESMPELKTLFSQNSGEIIYETFKLCHKFIQLNVGIIKCWCKLYFQQQVKPSHRLSNEQSWENASVLRQSLVSTPPPQSTFQAPHLFNQQFDLYNQEFALHLSSHCKQKIII